MATRTATAKVDDAAADTEPVEPAPAPAEPEPGVAPIGPPLVPEEPVAPEPPICGPCYGGVWPAAAWSASCVHGQWERPDPNADQA